MDDGRRQIVVAVVVTVALAAVVVWASSFARTNTQPQSCTFDPPQQHLGPLLPQDFRRDF